MAVRQTEGEYVEQSSLPLLDEAGGTLAGPRLPAKQTLDEIVADIIRKVLEEENMNQSRAAKRLGNQPIDVVEKLENE